MKIRFDAHALDLGHRRVPQSDIRRLVIETDVRRGWLVRALTIVAVGLGLLGAYAALTSTRPGLNLIYLAGYVLVLAVKGNALVEAVSEQEKFFTLWAEGPDGKVRILSVGDPAFAAKVRSVLDHVRLGAEAGRYEVDPAWGTIEPVAHPGGGVTRET